MHPFPVAAAVRRRTGRWSIPVPLLTSGATGESIPFSVAAAVRRRIPPPIVLGLELRMTAVPGTLPGAGCGAR